MAGQTRFEVRPGGALRGTLNPPGDKSVSHRAVMLGGVATGSTRVRGYLDSEDVRATVTAMRALGVRVERTDDELVIAPPSDGDLCPPDQPLDMGNSGTAMRLLAGLLAGRRVPATLTGDASLSRRPMRRVIEPLGRMGAVITARDGLPPLRIEDGGVLSGIEYHLPVASAQVKSAILLAALYARGRTVVTEPAVTRDHTERMLRQFGCDLEVSGRCCVIVGGQALKGQTIQVPGDLSSAAFFIVAALIAPDSEIRLRGVGVNPTRTGVIEILRLMGARIELSDARSYGAEPVADILVRTSQLRGIAVPEAMVPLAIDEFPAIAVAAACASGETLITGAGELRVKESDRIRVMAEALTALGGVVQEQADGMTIQGGPLCGGRVQSHGDHRIAMAGAIAGLVCSDPVIVEDCANVATSFPGFVESAASLGLDISQHAAPSG